MIVTLICFGAVIAALVSLGIVFSLGSGSSLIAGFNTLSKKEKDAYDTVALCRFMGKMMFALSFSLIIGLFSIIYEVNWVLYFSIALFTGILIFLLIYVNTKDRFKGLS